MPENNSWECHKCHSVWAPSVLKCPNCEPIKTEGINQPQPKLLLEDRNDRDSDSSLASWLLYHSR